MLWSRDNVWRLLSSSISGSRMRKRQVTGWSILLAFSLITVFTLSTSFKSPAVLLTSTFNDYDVDSTETGNNYLDDVIAADRFPAYVNELRKRHLNTARRRLTGGDRGLAGGDSDRSQLRPILERLAPYYSDDDKLYWYDDYAADLQRVDNQPTAAVVVLQPHSRTVGGGHIVRNAQDVAEKLRADTAIKQKHRTSIMAAGDVRAGNVDTALRVEQQEQMTSDSVRRIMRSDGKGDTTRHRRSLQQAAPASRPQSCQLPADAVTGGIFWSARVEQAVAAGVSDADVRQFRSVTSSARAMRLQAAAWNACGRPHNALVHFLPAGGKACARHRHPDNRFVLGDVLSFYLARLMGLDNVPAVVLMEVNSSDVRWNVTDLRLAHWISGDMLSVSLWIDGLDTGDVTMPGPLLAAYTSGIPLSFHNVTCTSRSIDTDYGHNSNTLEDLVNLQQWSNLILFDYLTGNYDRVASMQDGAELEGKPSVLQQGIRNLYRQVSGKLWLVDNESSLLDGYDLLYRSTSASRFTNYHVRMLHSICMFSRSTVKRLQRLADQARPVQVLIDLANESDPLFAKFSSILDKQLFITYFDKRLNEVLFWVKQCEKNYM